MYFLAIALLLLFQQNPVNSTVNPDTPPPATVPAHNANSGQHQGGIYQFIWECPAGYVMQPTPKGQGPGTPPTCKRQTLPTPTVPATK